MINVTLAESLMQIVTICVTRCNKTMAVKGKTWLVRFAGDSIVGRATECSVGPGKVSPFSTSRAWRTLSLWQAQIQNYTRGWSYDLKLKPSSLFPVRISQDAGYIALILWLGFQWLQHTHGTHCEVNLHLPDVNGWWLYDCSVVFLGFLNVNNFATCCTKAH